MAYDLVTAFLLGAVIGILIFLLLKQEDRFAAERAEWAHERNVLVQSIISESPTEFITRVKAAEPPATRTRRPPLEVGDRPMPGPLPLGL